MGLLTLSVLRLSLGSSSPSFFKKMLFKWWPSCEGSDSNEDFWSHEWEKHGTCSGLDMATYFETALKLRAEYGTSNDNDICFL